MLLNLPFAFIAPTFLHSVPPPTSVRESITNPTNPTVSVDRQRFNCRRTLHHLVWAFHVSCDRRCLLASIPATGLSLRVPRKTFHGRIVCAAFGACQSEDSSKTKIQESRATFKSLLAVNAWSDIRGAAVERVRVSRTCRNAPWCPPIVILPAQRLSLGLAPDRQPNLDVFAPPLTPTVHHLTHQRPKSGNHQRPDEAPPYAIAHLSATPSNSHSL